MARREHGDAAEDTMLCDSRGQVIEQIRVCAGSICRKSISDSRPGARHVRTEGMHWVRQEFDAEMPRAPALSAYRASELPPGFHLTVSGRADARRSVSAPATHLVYSDGLRHGIGVRRGGTAAPLDRDSGRLGGGRQAVAAEPPMQGLDPGGVRDSPSPPSFEGHQVTAVGEVPAQTVEFIAHSVKSFGGDRCPRAADGAALMKARFLLYTPDPGCGLCEEHAWLELAAAVARGLRSIGVDVIDVDSDADVSHAATDTRSRSCCLAASLFAAATSTPRKYIRRSRTIVDRYNAGFVQDNS